MNSYACSDIRTERGATVSGSIALKIAPFYLWSLVELFIVFILILLTNYEALFACFRIPLIFYMLLFVMRCIFRTA